MRVLKKDILLSQLEVYGFDERSREMVESYLSNRTTKCRVKGCLSGEVELDSGVGEGSVLGPGFYICGMCSVNVVVKRVRLEMAEEGYWVDAWTLEFADDTSGLLVAKDEAELRAKARQFLASCDTLVTKRDAVGAAGAKSLQGSPEGREESGLGISRPERLENRGPTRFNEASLQEPLRAFDVGSR